MDALPDALELPAAPAIPHATAVTTSQPLPLGGGCLAVPTPGHTPGHHASHFPEPGVVIGGDVVFNFFRMRPAPALTCWRTAVNVASVTTIADLAPKTLLLAHGSAVTEDATGKLRELAARS